MIVPHTNKYWIDIYDDLDDFDSNAFDGFWVVFCRENLKTSDSSKIDFLTKTILFCNVNKIRWAKISYPYYDRILIFTDCDKRVITKLKTDIIDDFCFCESDMIWESLHESEHSWSENGWLNILDKAFCELEALVEIYDKDYKKTDALMHKSFAFQKALEENIMNRKSMVVKPVFNNISYEVIPKTVFIIMPFNEAWSNDIKDCIYEICRGNGIKSYRADDMFDTQRDVISDIWKGINEAELIIADISVKNANVFYELGIAHTLGKDIVLIKQQNSDEMPFDIIIRRYIKYGIMPSDFAKFKIDLNETIRNFFNL